MQLIGIPARIGVITKQAFSIPNFRGPLVREMVRQGHQVFALSSDYDEEMRAAVRALGAQPVDYSLAPTALSPLRDMRDALGLARVLRGLQLDVTLAYFIKPVVYGSIAARLAGVPRRHALIEGAGYAFEAAPGLKRRMVRLVASTLYRIGLAQTHGVFVLNRDDVALFGNGLVDPAKLTLLNGIGVELDHFRTEPVPSGPPVFIMAARLIAEKGVREYAAAARQVKARWPEARFLLIGAADSNPGALSAEEVRGWVAEGILEWPGEVRDVRPWLARAGIFVLPSYYREGLPRSSQEAMAMGRAVITTDWTGCRETVDDGVNGVLVPPRDVAALAQAMERFVRDPELAGRMGAAGRRLAEERFDVHRLNAQMLHAMGLQAP